MEAEVYVRARKVFLDNGIKEVNKSSLEMQIFRRKFDISKNVKFLRVTMIKFLFFLSLRIPKRALNVPSMANHLNCDFSTSISKKPSINVPMASAFTHLNSFDLKMSRIIPFISTKKLKTVVKVYF